MTFKFKDYQIKSYDYGYMAQRKVGRQWKIVGYYQNLQSAVIGTFHYRVLTETTDSIIDATDAAAIRLQSASLLQAIESIATELEEAIRHGQK
jgi:hypothetical protein